MSFAKVAFFGISVLISLLAVYVHHSTDENVRNEFYFVLSRRIDYCFTQIDRWLRMANINGFLHVIDRLYSEAVFRTFNRTGLKIDVMRFGNVEVVIYDPNKGQKAKPAMVYFHGGGWCRATAKILSLFTAELARRINTTIISVDYRKAPEHPFPVPFQDCVTATKFLFDNAKKFHIDPNRIGLIGDSAGGNLVLAVGYHFSELKSKNATLLKPKILVSISPSLQAVDFQTPSYRDNVNDFMVSKYDIAEMMCNYALGMVSSTEIAKCIQGLLSNSHVSAHVLDKVKNNIDWKKHLSDDEYSGYPKSTFGSSTHLVNKKFSDLVMMPTFSPLSALSDAQLAILPSVYIFGAKRDPLRDDARIMAARLSKLSRPYQYEEVDYYHNALVFYFTGIKESVRGFQMLIDLFNHNAIL